MYSHQTPNGSQPNHAEGPSQEQIEWWFQCPHCWEQVSVLLDPSVPGQTFVEDCEVCCRPVAIRYRIDRGVVTAFGTETLE